MRTIRHYIDQRAQEQPDTIYMIAPEPSLTLTYGQLRDDSIRLGKHLVARGLKKGDKVSFMMGNGYQTTKIFLGTMYAGLVVAPLNLMAQPSQLEYVMYHSDTRLVFYTADQKERLEAAASNVEHPIELVQIDNDAEDILPEEDLSSVTLPELEEEDDALLL